MKLSLDQVRTAILEDLNIRFKLQKQGIQFDDETSILDVLKLDRSEDHFIYFDMICDWSLMFNFDSFEFCLKNFEEIRDFMRQPFGKLVNYFYAMGWELYDELDRYSYLAKRESFSEGDKTIYTIDILRQIIPVLRGKFAPTYTLSLSGKHNKTKKPMNLLLWTYIGGGKSKPR